MSIKILEKKQKVKVKMKKEKNFWVENCENGIDVITNKVEPYGVQRYKISILNTDFDCKKIKLSNRDGRYYYSYIFPNGSEKINRSRAECEYCVGSENLLLAENQIEKNLKRLSKQLKTNLKNPVMEKLSLEVEKYVKYYKSDFYHWDNYFIARDSMRKFILVLRDSGTYLLPLLSNTNYSINNHSNVDYMLKNEDNYKCFLCDMSTESVIEISITDIANYIK
jgi:hypothetical protein